MIHDAQLDYYGKRLATCSSDRTIRIFDVVNGKPKGDGVVLKGHTAPIWQISWAHPSFGSILASCSYDSRVFVWKETSSSTTTTTTNNRGLGGGIGMGKGAAGGAGEWEKIKEVGAHSASVNSISWAPYELGPILACASSDGKISVLKFNNDGSSDIDTFPAHAIGVNAISWSPAMSPGSLTSGPQQQQQQQQPGQQQQQQQGGAGSGEAGYQKKFASAGCDGVVRIWNYKDLNGSPEIETTLNAHSDWVRDVAWAPNIGLPGEYIATCGQDRTVQIHFRPSPTSAWTSTKLLPHGSDNPDPLFPDAVWRVSWSLAGNVLAVACADGKVTLWKEVIGGKGWECVNEISG
ncbi:hypothetical protein FFLO_04164 [Filobasidium floriforme]|uniref:Uncharacterized protein n=1 Tax=Filobasidium floriforme TaxID=5210 RepID=A0A8K0JJF2_9TREE|nr:hypothetical protein FFLO_04164 [Filobasidium floriforme]